MGGHSKTHKEYMTQFKQYRRKGFSEMVEWEEGMVIDHVSISDADKANGSPKKGDMIARSPKNHNDQWLVAKKYFEENLELVEGKSLDEKHICPMCLNQYPHIMKSGDISCGECGHLWQE